MSFVRKLGKVYAPKNSEERRASAKTTTLFFPFGGIP